MGFNDRDYAREDGPGIWIGSNWSMVTNLIVITLGVFVLQILADNGAQFVAQSRLTRWLGLESDLFTNELWRQPWKILTLVTYGFAHAWDDLMHVAFNLFFLWLFGREIEARYGRQLFLKLYLTLIVVSGLGWMLVHNLTEDRIGILIGASGAVSGILTLFVVLYPKRIVMIWGVLPVPMWVFGLFWLWGDVSGALGRETGDVAYTAHLSGAAFALVFYKTGFTFGSLLPRNLSLRRPGKPRLKVHDPDQYEQVMSDQVDAILEKIQKHGQDSLTAKERRTLEEASRRYQQKHR